MKRILSLSRNDVLTLSLLLTISLLFPILILNRIRSYNLPVGGDSGIWLKWSYAIFENSYPTWGESPLQHGPLPFLILYPLSKIMGEIWALNVVVLTVMILRPIAVFFFTKKLLKNVPFALLCSAIDAFFPSYYEMYGFCSYPNLLAFVLLPLTFGYVLDAQTRPKDFVIFGILSTLTILSHHLSSMIFLMIMFFWMVSRLILVKDRPYKFMCIVLLITFLSFGMVQLFMGGESDYTFFNEFAYYGRVITIDKVIYVFKDLILLFFLGIFALGGIFGLFKNNKQGSTLLLSWLVTPLLFYVVSYYMKFLVIDYTRLLFYIVQPLIISSICFLQNLWQKRNALRIPFGKDVHREHAGSIVITLAFLLMFASFNFGYVTKDNVISYYKATLESKFSDQNSYDAVMWIKENLGDNVTIVTRAGISRYIEGIAHKRILKGNTNPKDAFRQGEYERILASIGILTSNIIGSSDMFIVRDQTPILFGRTPYIYMFAGDNYKLLGYFSDDYGWELKELTSNVTQITISNSSYQIIYSDSYRTTKTVTLRNDEIQVSYNILKDPYKIPREKLGKSLYSSFWLPWGKNWTFSDSTLFTDYGEVKVIASSPVEKEYVPLWKQWRMVFSFNDELSVTFKMKNSRMVRGNVVLTTSNDLIKQYGVTHALIRVDDAEAMKWIQSTGDWKLIYNNTLFYLYCLDRK